MWEQCAIVPKMSSKRSSLPAPDHMSSTIYPSTPAILSSEEPREVHKWGISQDNISSTWALTGTQLPTPNQTRKPTTKQQNRLVYLSSKLQGTHHEDQI
jgi:hypothetical protein